MEETNSLSPWALVQGSCCQRRERHRKVVVKVVDTRNLDSLPVNNGLHPESKPSLTLSLGSEISWKIGLETGILAAAIGVRSGFKFGPTLMAATGCDTVAVRRRGGILAASLCCLPRGSSCCPHFSRCLRPTEAC